jgi:3-hydroxy-9,10-secoandrosta-1,3,5(10)-triene-9,17-dione monooxygenase reductase component
MPRPDPDQFRAAMAQMPAAVTVLSAHGQEGPAGATASAVSSLSLDPPLMIAALDRGSRTLLAVQAANRFGINVLGADQEDVARAFATKAPVPEKWDGIAWSERGGIPAIDNALVWVACDLRDIVAGGDHVVLTGEVAEVSSRPGEPLLIHRGTYRAGLERRTR